MPGKCLKCTSIAMSVCNTLFPSSSCPKLYINSHCFISISFELTSDWYKLLLNLKDRCAMHHCPLSVFPASCTRHSSGDSAAAAHPPAAGLVRRLVGQHAGPASVRPDPTGGSNILQRKLFGLSEASSRTGELLEYSHRFIKLYWAPENSFIYIFHNYKPQTVNYLCLFTRAGGHGSWEGVAPGALCVHWVWDRVRQSQLLWKGRAAVLRVGLLHALLPSLCAMQQAHSKCERLSCACHFTQRLFWHWQITSSTHLK